ncbi:MAG: FecR domain-containing protein, partial [Candidatus Eremiobacteraeota bacterium]|nr:FecR domain-containing protein [Candidatus Eremiobacteraeota bacterium]
MHLFRQVPAAMLVAAMAVTGVATITAPAAAQSYGSNYGYNYGSPGVAAVSVANGGVVILRGDSGQQVAATVNAPVVPGDYVATSPGAVAEIQFDGTSMLRLANNTQVRMINLAPGSREIQLASGTIDLAQLQGAANRTQVDTPSLTVRPNQNGDTRVTVLGNGETLVTVRSGSATVSGANGSQTIAPGSTLVAYGSSMRQQNPVGFDAFDQFNIARDRSVVSSYNANPYISPQLAGYSNFANYGRWQNVPGYGYAWAPNDQNQNNFAPYQNGQWVWEPGYGYTWVDNSPTGYATSHYGSWFNNANYGGWLWQPPGYQSQNSSSSLASAWLPAVVSFFLTGSNGGDLGSLSSGFSNLLGNSSNANIGWIPLAPGEQYQPWYGQNYSYPQTSYSQVPNVTNIYNYYGNARYYRGITMVPVSAWRGGNFTRVIAVRPQQLRGIVLIRGAVPVVPTTANLHYTTVRTVKTPIVLSRAFASPRFVAKVPTTTRHTFQEQQAQIRNVASRLPKAVALAHRAEPAPHPVYHPAPREAVHYTPIAPVAHSKAVTTEKAVKHNRVQVAKPAEHSAAQAEETVAKPAQHAAQSAPKPEAKHAAVPLEKSIVHTAQPLSKPVERTPAPIQRPVMRVAPPVQHTPVLHP